MVEAIALALAALVKAAVETAAEAKEADIIRRAAILQRLQNAESSLKQASDEAHAELDNIKRGG